MNIRFDFLSKLLLCCITIVIAVNSNAQTISAPTGTGITSPACTGTSFNLSVTITNAGSGSTLIKKNAVFTAEISTSSTFASNIQSIGSFTLTANAATNDVVTINASLAGIAAGTYYYRVTCNTPVVNGAISSAQTINAIPTAPTNIDGSRCGTGTVSLSATTTAGNTIDWYAASTGGTALLSGNTSYTTPSISATTIYYAETRNSSAGCISTSRTAVTATINAAPAAPTGTNGSRCGTGTVSLSATGTAGTTIDWYAASTGGTALLSGNTSYTTPSISATTSYYAEARNTTTGCVSSTRTTVTATINASVTPSVSISSSDADNIICTGTSVTFTATPTNGGTPSYQWKLDGVNVGTNSSTYVTSALTNSQVVSVVMTTSLTCVSSATATSGNITTTVNPLNTISLSSAAGTDAQVVIGNGAITPITYATTTATGATVTGLPADVTYSFANNTVTISGIPISNGVSTYTVTLTGGCGTVTATGTITKGSAKYAVTNLGSAGSWNSTNTWASSSGGAAGAGVPVAGDLVYIETGKEVNLDVTPAAINQLNISGTGKLNVTANNITIPVVATWSSTSTLNITGTAATLPADDYGNIILNNASTLTASGNINVNGNMTLTSGTFVQVSNINSLNDVTIQGNLTLNGGVYDFSTANNQINTVLKLNLYGNLTQTSTGKIFTSARNTVNGTVYFMGSGVKTMSFTNLTSSEFVDYDVALGTTLQMQSNLGLNRYNSTGPAYAGTMDVKGTLDLQSYSISSFTGSSVGGGQASQQVAFFYLRSGGKIITQSATGIVGAVSTTNLTATFENSTSYEFNGTTQSTGTLPSSVTNVTFSGTGTKTFSNATVLTINATLSIGDGSTALIPNGLTYTAGQLVFGSQVQANSFWAGTSASVPFTGSSSPYTYTVGGTGYKAFKDSTRFGNTTSGILQVGAAALPVILSNFTAKVTTDNKVNLAWVTASESNNKGFWIERQSEGDGKFNSLGFISSKAEGGNSQSMIAYSFKDISAKLGTNTYRLVQEDFDGKQTFSEVRIVKLNGQSVVSVYPNPSTGSVNINRTNDGKKMNVQILDQMGRIISQYQNISDSSLRLNIPQSGIYQIKLMYPETGEQSIQRIVVQH